MEYFIKLIEAEIIINFLNNFLRTYYSTYNTFNAKLAQRIKINQIMFESIFEPSVPFYKLLFLYCRVCS